MQQGLALPSEGRPVQALRRQTEPGLSQWAQGGLGDATWLGSCQLRGAIPRLVDSLSVTDVA